MLKFLIIVHVFVFSFFCDSPDLTKEPWIHLCLSNGSTRLWHKSPSTHSFLSLSDHDNGLEAFRTCVCMCLNHFPLLCELFINVGHGGHYIIIPMFFAFRTMMFCSFIESVYITSTPWLMKWVAIWISKCSCHLKRKKPHLRQFSRYDCIYIQKN